MFKDCIQDSWPDVTNETLDNVCAEIGFQDRHLVKLRVYDGKTRLSPAKSYAACMRDHALRQYDMSDASDAAAFWADIDYVDMLQIAQLEAIARDKGTELPVNSCGRAHERWFQFRHGGIGSMLYSIGSRPHGEAVFSTGHARSANGNSEICAVTNRDVMVAADATMNLFRDTFDDLRHFADTAVHTQLFDGNSETLLRFSTRKRDRMLASWQPGGGHRIAFDNRTAE